MRANYTAEIIPYELDKDRSRAYMGTNGLREAHLKPGQHVRIAFCKRETVLKIVPKFDGDENAVYLPREELAHLSASPGDLLSVEKFSEECPEADEVTVSFKVIRKTVERLESLRLMLTDKKVISHGEMALGGVVHTEKKERVKITENTKIKIETEERILFPVGLEKEAEEVKNFIDLAHAKDSAVPENTHSLVSLSPEGTNSSSRDADRHFAPSHGLIVTGEIGMGKRTLCLYVLQETGKEWVRVHGNSVRSIEESFEYAKLNEPCTIWIDRIERYLEEKQNAAVICLERIFDEIGRERRRIAIIATAVSLDKIPQEIKCAHILDRVVSLHAPTLYQREKQLLDGLLQHRAHRKCTGGNGLVDAAAKRTAGFTRGEIYLLLRDSLERPALSKNGMQMEKAVYLDQAIKRLTIQTGSLGECDGHCMDRLMSRIVRFVPSASEGAPAEVPDIRFSCVLGQDEAKERLKEAVIWPVVHGRIFEEAGLAPPRGVLLYGPPGCGKTLIAQALANESGAVFFSIRGPEIMGKYVGESEERVRRVFARARAQTPSIIFIDEIDSIAPHREAEGGQVDKRVVSTLLTEMDGIGSDRNIFVLGATNKPWSIDSALMRPGRFDCHVLVDLPTEEIRKELFSTRLTKTIDAIRRWQGEEEFTEEDGLLYEYFAGKTHGFTGAEIKGLCTEISTEAVRHRIEKREDLILPRLKEIVEKASSRIPQREIDLFRLFSRDPSGRG